MRLSSLGEFGLIRLIKDAVQNGRQPDLETTRRLLVDIGDDAAAWSGSDRVQLATTDCLVEDVHFRFKWCSWEDLGYKSLAVNLSDIAAMGGVPRFALVSLSCPVNEDSESVMQYYTGMTHLAAESGVVIVGGNLTSSPIVTSTVCLIGEADGPGVLRRSAAMPGDCIAVTGSLGAAASALKLLSSGMDSAEISSDLKSALTRPHARLSESRILVQEGVRCAIDISDGLLSDLGHLCECSGVSATVHADRTPLPASIYTPWREGIRLALTGGEDYELLFTCDRATLDRVSARLECAVTVVGEITAGKKKDPITVLGTGDALPANGGAGWSHFRA